MHSRVDTKPILWGTGKLSLYLKPTTVFLLTVARPYDSCPICALGEWIELGAIIKSSTYQWAAGSLRQALAPDLSGLPGRFHVICHTARCHKSNLIIWKFYKIYYLYCGCTVNWALQCMPSVQQSLLPAPLKCCFANCCSLIWSKSLID